MIRRPRVIIESPFRGNSPEDAARNLAYANAALADSVRRGENPYASHILLTSALDDADPDQRALGIALGLEWAAVADFVAVYTDLGISDGMSAAMDRHASEGRRITLRRLPPPG